MRLFRREFLSASAAVATMGAAGPLMAQNAPAPASEPVSPGPSSTAVGKPPSRPYKAGAGEQHIKMFNLRELEGMAAKVIPADGYASIAGGACDEWTLKENQAAFQRVSLEPHYLAGHAGADTTTTLLGTPISMPIIITPMGGHGAAHDSKEAGTAKGAAAAGTIFAVSMMSNLTMEEVAAASDGPKWQQFYFPADKGLARDILHRAKAAGYLAIVMTLDSFAGSARETELRAGYKSPYPLANLPPVQPNPNIAGAQRKDLYKPDLDWDDVAFVQKESGLPVVLKGVLAPALAAQAVEHGVAAIQVSNHGGRQLDGAPATITMLPRIAEVVSGRIPIILDSGVRRGQDVFRALALGANAVALGRPVLYGLALGGATGVQQTLEHIKGELVSTMRLAGAPTVRDISAQYLLPGPHTRPT